MTGKLSFALIVMLLAVASPVISLGEISQTGSDVSSLYLKLSEVYKDNNESAWIVKGAEKSFLAFNLNRILDSSDAASSGLPLSIRLEDRLGYIYSVEENVRSGLAIYDITDVDIVNASVFIEYRNRQFSNYGIDSVHYANESSADGNLIRLVSPKQQSYPAGTGIIISAELDQNILGADVSAVFVKIEYDGRIFNVAMPRSVETGLYTSGSLSTVSPGLYNLTVYALGARSEILAIEKSGFRIDVLMPGTSAGDSDVSYVNVPVISSIASGKPSAQNNNSVPSEPKQQMNGTIDINFIQIDVVEPQVKEYSPSDTIQIVAAISSADQVSDAFAVIEWENGRVVQQLTNFNTKDQYETDFFNAFDSGIYNITVSARTADGTEGRADSYFIIGVGVELSGEVPHLNRNVFSRNEVISVKDRDKTFQRNAKLLISNEYKDKVALKGISAIFSENKKIESIDIENLTDFVKGIEFFNITTNGTIDLGIEDLQFNDSVQAYAIDPEKINFTSAIVSVRAKGRSLYKCAEWGFDSQVCDGSWQLVMDNLSEGLEYQITLTPNDPAFKEISIVRCWAEDAAAAAGVWGTVCDNVYPGTALFTDDAVYETHRVRRQGFTYYWAGLRTNSTNTTVTSCDRITKVYFCYKWWSATAQIRTCDVSIDSSAGASYTVLSNVCPGVAEPAAKTCVDVTGSEPWACRNFFNTSSYGALAKSEVRSNQAANGYANINWDVFYFNVTYQNFAPAWSNNRTNIVGTYSPVTASVFNITWYDRDGVSMALYESNYTGIKTNYTMPNLIARIYQYSKILPAGSHYWKSYANDTRSQWNSTATWKFTISKATPILTLTPKPAWTTTFGTQTNITCSADTTQISPLLYRNRTLISGLSDVRILGGGVYNYTCNNTLVQNYTATKTSNLLTINKATGSIYLYLNGSRANRTLPVNSFVNVSAKLISGTGGIVVYKNGTTIYSGNAPSENIVQVIAIGKYNFTANYPGNQNYTSSRDTWWVKSFNPPPYWSNNKSRIAATYSTTLPSQFNITWQDDVSVSSVRFESNLTGAPTNYSMPEVVAGVYSYSKVLPAGSFYWQSHANDSMNNWSHSPKWIFTIAKATPTIILTPKPGWTTSFGTQTNITCSADTGQISPLLYRNKTLVIGLSDVRTLGGGIYNYTCNNTAVQNYTSVKTSSLLTINKATGTIYLYLNGSRSNKTMQVNSYANVTAKLISGTGSIIVYRNGTAIYSGNAPSENIVQLTASGRYNFTANYPENQNYTSSRDTWWVDTYDLPALWSNNKSRIVTTYSPTVQSQFNITWQDDVSVSSARFESNFTGSPTNYTMSELIAGVYSYSKILPAGTFYWQSHANDSRGAWSNSPKWTFTIARATPVITLTPKPGWTTTFGTQTNITCSADTSQVSPLLYRNRTFVVGLSDVKTLGASIYNYTCNNTAVQNYTSARTSNLLTINKVTGSIFLYLNGSRANRTESVNSYINVTAKLITGTGSIIVYQNGTALYSGNPPSENIVHVTTVGKYNFTAYYPGNQNYTSSRDTWWVNSVDSPPYWSNNKSRIAATYSVSQQSQFNITWQDDVSVSSARFESNFTGSPANYSMSELVSEVYSYSKILPAGTFYWQSHANDANGMWSHSPKWSFTLAKATSFITLTPKPAWTTTYGTQTNITCSADTSQINPLLYRNKTLVIGLSDVKTLGASQYNYTCNNTVVQNYTAAKTSNLLAVNKATGTIQLFLDSQRKNITVYNNSYVSIEAVLENGTGNLYVYRNATQIYYGPPPSYNNSKFNRTTLYNISAYYPGNQNFTSSRENWSVTVIPTIKNALRMRIIACRAEDAAAAAGVWGTVCDNAYPGNALFLDDAVYEVHRIRRTAGPTYYWAGLRINATNNTITDCQAITNVRFCYKWWAATAQTRTCDISVDSSLGASYTAASAACPAVAEPASVTCADVTALEAWNCNNFFGTKPIGAMAKSEVRSNQAANGYANINWDVFYFNVTYDKKSYQTFYGNVTGEIKIGQDQKILRNYGSAPITNIFISDYDSDIDFDSLQAIGRKKDGTASTNDFAEIDSLLVLGGKTDRPSLVWGSDASTPKQTKTMVVYDTTINNVPVVNSTSSNKYMTGILWDTSDSANNEFDTADAEDLVFVTNYTVGQTGLYGKYGYELKIPATLIGYKGASNYVAFYTEVQ